MFDRVKDVLVPISLQVPYGSISVSRRLRDRKKTVTYTTFAILNTYLWWKNRKNRKRDRAPRELGAKSRAVIAGMVRRLTPSPIPTPAGG